MPKFFIVFLTLLGTLIAVSLAVPHFPNRYAFWRPIGVGEPIGPFTDHKISQLTGDECLAFLEQMDVRFTPVEDRATRNDCGWNNAVRIGAIAEMSLMPKNPRLSCKASASLAIWAKEALQPNSQSVFDQPVSQLLHFGTYSCRNVAGTLRRSTHARAAAIDISGFTLANGNVVSVLRHWKEDAPQKRFLHATFHDACAIFTGALGPDYNAAHRDHFHLEVGGFSMCR